MDNNILFKDYSSIYENNWVALDAFTNGNVLAYGKDMRAVHKEAIDKGCKNPIVFHITQPDSFNIFYENAL